MTWWWTSKDRLIEHLHREHGLPDIGHSKSALQRLHGALRKQKDCGWRA